MTEFHAPAAELRDRAYDPADERDAGLFPPIVEDRAVVGSEVPRYVYRTMVLAYVVILLAAWIGFAQSGPTAWDVVVSAMIFAMTLGIPSVIRHISFHHQRSSRLDMGDFLEKGLDVWGGHLSGRQAAVQILVIPVVLAAGAIAFATIRLIEMPVPGVLS